MPSPISADGPRDAGDSSIARTLLRRLTHSFWLRMATMPRVVTAIACASSSFHELGPIAATEKITR